MNKLGKLVDHMFSTYYLFQLRRNQWKSTDELKRMQLRRLRAIVRFAYDYVPYYHRLFDSRKIKPDNIRSHVDLERIPITAKKDVQENNQAMIANGIDASKLPSNFTSGSTGTPMKIVVDRFGMDYFYSSVRYPFLECGVRPSDKFVTVWGRAQSVSWGRRYEKIWGNMAETIVPLYKQEKLIKVLRQIDPDVIYTFPSALVSLSRYDVSGINPRLVFTQGETVTKHCRDIVRDMFGLELFETYGSVEFDRLAFECEEHCGLHMITDGACIELVDKEGSSVAPGEEGEIVVTGLRNYAMPMIRYGIGDIGTSTEEQCPCGRTWPLMESIQGRINDYLVLPSGRIMSWLHFYHHFYKELEKSVFCISQYQINQETRNSIVFKVVKGKKYEEDVLRSIRRNLETFFAEQGEYVEVHMEVVDEVPMERTGKRRMLISMINRF